MRMKKRLAALLLVLALLCGCAPRRAAQGVPYMPSVEEPQLDPAPTATPQPTPALPEGGALYGSVQLLEEPTVLVSVYLNDAATGSVWSREAQDEAQQQVAMAVDWINSQAAGYGVQPQLYCDDGSAGSPLRHTYQVQARLKGGPTSEESNEFLTEMDMLCATLDTADLRERYGTDRVGFLLFLPVSGTSFTMAHYAEDGANFYYEYCCLYRYDAYSEQTEPESPATYAHEILHLFGAPDLYAGSSDLFVDEDLSAYVAQTYPDEIMLDTYAADGTNDYTAIDKIISPLTAYCIGLADTCPERELFPLLAGVEPGVFRYDVSTGQDSGPGSGAVAV